jgi:serine/threonine protein phosphatase PrpC
MTTLAVSHTGKRDINQDLILEYTAIDGSYLFAVIDGMGGYRSGEVAARMIRENIETYLSTVDTIDAFHIQKSINKSNLAIRQQNFALSENMGATIGGVILNGGCVCYFWVGDVKIFHFRNKKLLFESTPHSLVKHVVTRSIQGDIKTSQAEISLNALQVKSDLLIVCSDGVHDLYDGIQIENLLMKNKTFDDSFESMLSRLLLEANDNFSLGFLFM